MFKVTSTRIEMASGFFKPKYDVETHDVCIETKRTKTMGNCIYCIPSVAIMIHCGCHYDPWFRALSFPMMIFNYSKQVQYLLGSQCIFGGRSGSPSRQMPTPTWRWWGQSPRVRVSPVPVRISRVQNMTQSMTLCAAKAISAGQVRSDRSEHTHSTACPRKLR